jgi:hypothetical protein
VRFVNDYLGVVADRAGRRWALASTLPMRAPDPSGKPAPIDMALTRHGDFFAPKNSATHVELPAQLTRGLLLQRSGLRLTPQVVNNVSGRDIGSRLFYGDVAKDSDVLITPTPGGAELITQLRSADSPLDQFYSLSLPQGESAGLAADGSGVEILRSGHRVATVGAPVAWDADGTVVPTSYRLVGNELIVSTSHRQGDFRYPITVDPYAIEDSDFRSPNSGDASFVGWNWFQWHTSGDAMGLTEAGPEGNGLYVYANPGWTIPRGDNATWTYKTPADTNIFRVDSWASEVPFYGYFTLDRGIVNTGPSWAPGNPHSDAPPAFTDRLAQNCADAAQTCTDEWAGTTANEFWWRYEALYDVTVGANTYGYLHQAFIYMHDQFPPVVAKPPDTETNAGWRPGGYNVPPFVVSATDRGLGMPEIDVTGGNVNLRSKPWCTGGRAWRCPLAAPTTGWDTTFSYSTDQLPDGITNMTATAWDIANQSGINTWQVKVDRRAPTITSIGGTLWDHRTRTDDHRNEGIYDSTYTLTAGARDGDASLRQSGLKSVTIMVDGQQKSVWVPDCVGTDNCSGQMPSWTFASDLFQDGAHTVTVIAKDLLADNPGVDVGQHTTSTSFEVTVDRHGDVYHAREYGTDPAGGAPAAAEEWARIGTHTARHEDFDKIATRATVSCQGNQPVGTQCDEVRQRSRLSETDAGARDAYEVYRGSSTNDPSLLEVADVLGPAGNQDQVSASGPILDALLPSQRPPPAHGTQYLMYRSESDDPDQGHIVLRLFVDSGTQMPLRVEQEHVDGGYIVTSYYTYDVDRKSVGDYPADFFQLGRPANPGKETNVVTAGASPLGAVSDIETRLPFTPYYLGATPHLDQTLGPSQHFCLDKTDSVTFSAPTPPDSPAVTPPQDPNAPVGSPYAPETFTDATYRLLGGSETCTPGAGIADTPQLQVIAYARTSTDATAWRNDFQSTGQAVALDPNDPDYANTGIVPVHYGLTPTVAYLVTAGGQTSALMDIGDTTLIVHGPLTQTNLQQILDQLTPR